MFKIRVANTFGAKEHIAAEDETIRQAFEAEGLELGQSLVSVNSGNQLTRDEIDMTFAEIEARHPGIGATSDGARFTAIVKTNNA